MFHVRVLSALRTRLFPSAVNVANAVSLFRENTAPDARAYFCASTVPLVQSVNSERGNATFAELLDRACRLDFEALAEAKRIARGVV